MAALAIDTLVNSVGRMIAKLHGFPDYPYVIIPAPFTEGVVVSDEIWEQKIQDAVLTAEELLTGNSV